MQSQELTQGKVKTPDLAKEKNKLTVTLYVGGKQVESLTAEQSERIAERLSKSMSLYYTSHADEYQKIKENLICGQ